MSGAQYFSESRPSTWSPRIRWFHRWTSIVFTLSVVATSIALAQEKPILWISYVPLAPLFVLMITGLYMFATGSRRSAAD